MDREVAYRALSQSTVFFQADYARLQMVGQTTQSGPHRTTSPPACAPHLPVDVAKVVVFVAHDCLGSGGACKETEHDLDAGTWAPPRTGPHTTGSP